MEGAELFPGKSDAQVEAELAQTTRQLEMLKATGGAARAATSATAAPASDEDWTFIRAEQCTKNNLVGDGAGCKGVYKFVSPVTGEAFAVKLVARYRSSEAAAKHSFEKEVSIFYKVRHPGICRLRTVVTDEQYHMLVFELCEKGELFSEVARGALSEPVARDYFTQIIDAVDYCHSKRIYHRDLKLENVLLTDETTKCIKIGDFGMARDCCSINSMPKTKGMGTVSYMAPEVSAPDALAPYDGAAADVWSIGVMLYVMVVCNYPFGHDGVGGLKVQEIFRRARAEEYRFPPHATLSAEIKDLITGMLKADPQQRLTIAQIRTHPWVVAGGYNGAEFTAAMEDDEHPELKFGDLPLDSLESLDSMDQMGSPFSFDDGFVDGNYDDDDGAFESY